MDLPFDLSIAPMLFYCGGYLRNRAGLQRRSTLVKLVRGSPTRDGDQPRWRRDGKELLYHAPDGKLTAVPVKADSTFEAGIPVVLFDTQDLNPGEFGYDVRPGTVSCLLPGPPFRAAPAVNLWPGILPYPTRIGPEVLSGLSLGYEPDRP